MNNKKLKKNNTLTQIILNVYFVSFFAKPVRIKIEQNTEIHNNDCWGLLVIYV